MGPDTLATLHTRQLAATLAQNHIHLSFPPELYDLARRQMLKKSKVEEARAVVVVVGAGASKNAAGLPLGETTRQLLQQQLQIPSNWLETELTRLSVQYRLERNEFETQLLAFSKFTGSRLRDQLGDIFSRRFYATLVYEILAHLLKHRFVDAIINFNFDELLDQAIDDEVGRGNYYEIVSDGKLPDDVRKLQDEFKRFRMPLYVKPHGTASHKSSLRFTREAYFLLPENIRDLLLALLSETPTTVILVGFGMQSVEFTSIMQTAAINNSLEVYAIDPDPRIVERLPSDIEKRVHVPLPRNGRLGDLLTNLWATVCECFSQDALPRRIYRHRVMNALFWEKVNYEQAETKRHADLTHYLRDRTIVEIGLAIAKAKGFVNIEQLAMSRAGLYFQHYLEHEPKTTDTLYSLCESLRLSMVGYSPNTLRLAGGASPLAFSPDELIVSSESWPNQKSILIETMLSQLSPTRQTRVQRRPNIKLLNETLDYLYKSNEVEVFTPRKSPHRIIFRSPLHLSSLIAVKMSTRQMLETNWTRLWCVAETGQWLLEPEIVNLVKKHPGSDLVIVVADRVYENDLRRTYQISSVNLQIVQMPWWLHNQHVSLTLVKTKPKSAIYFERRLRSLFVAPVRLRERDDLDRVMDTFLAYWIKAERFEKNRDEVFIQASDIDKARQTLLR